MNQVDLRAAALAAVAWLAAFEPRIAHRADSLDLVGELILAGLGVGLLPSGLPPRPGIHLTRLTAPDVVLRAFAVTRRGRAGWAPVRLLLDRLGVYHRGG